MMFLLSLIWWKQKLTGVTAQAVGVVVLVALVVGGIAWLRHDARMDERNSWELRMTKARLAQAALRAHREKTSLAIGFRAEKALGDELDVLAKQNEELERKLAERPVRSVCYPKEIIQGLNR